MAYREVALLEVKEVLRLWLNGIGKKRIAAQLGFDVTTVRQCLQWGRGVAEGRIPLRAPGVKCVSN